MLILCALRPTAADWARLLSGYWAGSQACPSESEPVTLASLVHQRAVYQVALTLA